VNCISQACIEQEWEKFWSCFVGMAESGVTDTIRAHCGPIFQVGDSQLYLMEGNGTGVLLHISF
jgi:hypothetical protein